jgi:uncharacterized protein YbaP (TraB family)
MRFNHSSVTAILVLIFSSPAFAADGSHPLSMWQINGQVNRIYLLGSIHLLREEDHPLPAAIYRAYDDADKIIMELDMDDMDPVASQALTNELGLIQDGRTLVDLMGADRYAEAAQLAEVAQIPLSLLDKSEPWFAAMNVEIMLLMRIGFNPAYGIETHLMELAKSDQKEILGFETIRQQLEFLDGLSADAQREMLIQALSEGASMREMMDSMIEAWRLGDLEYMEENLLADMQDYPELNRIIVIDRNIDWTNKIEDLLDDKADYLIVVGALHLIGEDGVPGLLESRGHEVTQLYQAVE